MVLVLTKLASLNNTGTLEKLSQIRDLFPRWDERRLEREAAAKAKEQQKPPVPPTKVGQKCLFWLVLGLLEPCYLVFRLLAKNQKRTAEPARTRSPVPFRPISDAVARESQKIEKLQSL